MEESNRPNTKFEEWMERHLNRKFGKYREEYVSLEELEERDRYQSQIYKNKSI